MKQPLFSTAKDFSPERLAGRLSRPNPRLLLFGASGTGKSSLADSLAPLLTGAGQRCHCLGADPGIPSFGVPGAVCLGRWEEGGWRLVAMEALCTLDAGRFRLPLITAVRRLAGLVDRGVLLVDAPGIVRSVAGAELLTGLAWAAAIDMVLVLAQHGENPPLKNELVTLGAEILIMEPSAMAHAEPKQQRARRRTERWEDHLRTAETRTITIDPLLFTGTPPPFEQNDAWPGRQIALLAGGRTLAMGEVVRLRGNNLQVKIAGVSETPDQYLVRDACRDPAGLLQTGRRPSTGRLRTPPPDVASHGPAERNSGPRPVVRLGEATGVLVNGVFGDPLLHLRLHQRKRSLLFDLGEGGRLPARLAHQVTDVFLSHAHFDHISGFLWLMRSRIGLARTCRIFGPPGIFAHIENLMNGILWDRVGRGGPSFEVAELHGNHLLVSRLQAGAGKTVPDTRPAPEGLLFEDGQCRVRCVPLAHGGITVLAYALELPPQMSVIKERLEERDLVPGPWLGELKKRLAAGDTQTFIELPDGSSAGAGRLAGELIHTSPSRKLVYATDLSDTAANRKQLAGLARDCDLFFCEAGFPAADRKYAEASGHLTARACGEIARSAGACQLVPFHFSRRYERRMEEIIAEVKDVFRRVVI